MNLAIILRSLLLVAVLIAPGFGQVDTVRMDESFNPNTLNEPQMDWPIILRPGESLPSEKSAAETDSTEDGYRVQILATRNYFKADSIKNLLLDDFKGEVYVTFDPPNYKVRVGNFRSRFQAEKVQAELAQMGYDKAWIIRTRIGVQPKTWQK